MTREEEFALIDAVLAGDKEAFEPLVTANKDQIYWLALRMLENEDDASDAAQEAFIKAYTSLGSFRRESRFSVWLYQMAKNICKDYLRRRKRHPVIHLQGEDNDNEDGEIEVPDERYSPEKLALRAENVQAVREAIAALPEDCREILVMREIGGLSYDELGKALELESGTVKSRLNRARKKLYALLVQSGNISDDLPSEITKGGAENE